MKDWYGEYYSCQLCRIFIPSLSFMITVFRYLFVNYIFLMNCECFDFYVISVHESFQRLKTRLAKDVSICFEWACQDF